MASDLSKVAHAHSKKLIKQTLIKQFQFLQFTLQSILILRINIDVIHYVEKKLQFPRMANYHVDVIKLQNYKSFLYAIKYGI